MSDVREALVALLFRQGVAWRQGVADAILAEFDVTPRGEGCEHDSCDRLAVDRFSPCRKITPEAAPTALPSVEDVRDEIAGHPIGSGYYSTTVGVDEATEIARAVLALFEGGGDRG